MPRPTDKKSLLDLSQKNFDILLAFAESIPESANMDLNGRDKNVRDVLVHLYEWHIMMLGFYKDCMGGNTRPFLPKGVTWQTLELVNHPIRDKHQKTSLASAVRLLRESHAKVMGIVKNHTDEELFTKKKYPWTGTTSLGAYLIGSLSSHYDWGAKTLKPMKKAFA